MATIKDVAEECHLSVTTVSLVLNNKPNRISEKTKQKILETAKKLHYQPSQIAISMITKKTQTVGLILPDISNLYFAALAHAIEEECASYGYTVVYGNTSDHINQDFEYLSSFLARGVDGLIFIHSNSFGEENQKKLLEMTENSNTPVLAVDRSFHSPKIPSVIVDQYAGGYEATKHLLDLGHRKIGCITGPENVNNSSERLRGYRRALEDAGIPYNPALVITGDFHAPSGSLAVPVLLKQRVTGIFACNDMMAIGVYQACRDMGISIPKDLSVVGFDDIFFSQYLDPPLSTVYQPVTEIGKEAARQVIAMINKDYTPGKKTVFLPSLNIRESSGLCLSEKKEVGKIG